MIYASGDFRKTIVIRTSDSIIGPWSDAKVVATCKNEWLHCYHVFWHPEFSNENGKKIYVTVANWQRYQKYLYEVELEKN